MKRHKKLFCMFLSFMLAVNILSVSAALPGKYPTAQGNATEGYTYNTGDSSQNFIHDMTGEYPSKLQGVEAASDNAFKTAYGIGTTNDKNVQYKSNPAKRFTVDGKSFILLDTDSEGNYFVMADDTYGTHAWVNVSSNNNADPANKWDIMWYEGTWKYDPENTNSIAYWLNNGFLTNGNTNSGVNYKLPDAIISSLVEKEWALEGGVNIADSYFHKLSDSWTQQYSGVAPYMTAKAKVALLSAMEYWTYWDDISPLPYNAEPTKETGNWCFWWLRSAGNREITGQKGIGALRVGFSAGQKGTANMYNACAIRPCFWLDKDFFKTVKLDIDGTSVLAGDTVLETVRSVHTKAELAELYDAETLVNGFGYAEYMPLAAQNPEISGTFSVGETLTAAYTYLHENEASPVAEGNTKFRWYSSEDGETFTAIDGATEKTYTAVASDAGKCLKVSIQCMDEDGNLASAVMTEKTPALREKQSMRAVLSGFYNQDGSTFDGSNGVMAKFEIESESASSAVLLLGVYDSNNRMVGMCVQTVSVTAGTDMYAVSTESFGGTYARAVVINSLTGLKPIAMGSISK